MRKGMSAISAEMCGRIGPTCAMMMIGSKSNMKNSWKSMPKRKMWIMASLVKDLNHHGGVKCWVDLKSRYFTVNLWIVLMNNQLRIAVWLMQVHIFYVNCVKFRTNVCA